MASTLEVGFDNGITSGLAQCLCISRITCSVNRPRWPDTPINTRGTGMSHHIEQLRVCLVTRDPAGYIIRLLRQSLLEVEQVVHAFGQQTKTINHEDTPACLAFAQPFDTHRRNDVLGNPTTCRTCADKHHFLLAEGFVLGLASRQQRAHGNRRGALNVVVEAAQFVAILFKQRHGVGLGEIFELQQHIRPATLYRIDEQRDEVFVFLAGYPLMAPAMYIGSSSSSRLLVPTSSTIGKV